MSNLSKGGQWSAELIKEKLGDRWTIEQIQFALNDLGGGISSNEELETLKLLLPAIQVPVDKLAVSRQPMPQGLSTQKPAGKVAPRKRKTQPTVNMPDLQQVLNVRSANPALPINIATTTNEADAAEQKMLAAEMTIASVNRAAETVRMISQAEMIGKLAEYNLLLNYYGLESSQDLEVCEQRLNAHLEQGRAELAQIEAEAQKLLSGANQLVSCIPGMQGVRL